MRKAWNKLDLTGQRFGNLLVIEEAPKPDDVSKETWKVRWRCLCDCGNECIKETSKLRSQGSICCPECAKKLYWKNRKEDLTGMVFGQLTVIGETEAPETVDTSTHKRIFWECRCSCGETVVVPTASLKSGKAIMCWTCAHYISNSYKRKDYTGQTFGDLTILEMIYPDRNATGKRKTKCKCKCSCGKEIIRGLDNVVYSKYHPSCGCKKNESMANAFGRDIVGQKFGRLLVEEVYYKKDGYDKPMAKCLCDCGNEIMLPKNYVQSSHTLSCGCLQKDMAAQANSKDWSGYITEFGIEILNIDHQDERGVRIYNCKCPVCGDIFQAIPAKIMGRPTISCGCAIESSYEKMTELILNELGLHYKTQYSFDDCVYKNKLRFDFAVIDDQNNIKFLIENDGKQHFEPVEFYGGQEGFEYNQKRDRIKNDYCKKNNITLLRFPYYFSREQIKGEIEKVI